MKRRTSRIHCDFHLVRRPCHRQDPHAGLRRVRRDVAMGRPFLDRSWIHRVPPRWPIDRSPFFHMRTTFPVVGRLVPLPQRNLHRLMSATSAANVAMSPPTAKAAATANPSLPPAVFGLGPTPRPGKTVRRWPGLRPGRTRTHDRPVVQELHPGVRSAARTTPCALCRPWPAARGRVSPTPADRAGPRVRPPPLKPAVRIRGAGNPCHIAAPVPSPPRPTTLPSSTARLLWTCRSFSFRFLHVVLCPPGRAATAGRSVGDRGAR